MDVSDEKKGAVGVSHGEHVAHAEHSGEVVQVQNVALADATAKAGVSPWTPSMFKVSTFTLPPRLLGP